MYQFEFDLFQEGFSWRSMVQTSLDICNNSSANLGFYMLIPIIQYSIFD